MVRWSAAAIGVVAVGVLSFAWFTRDRETSRVMLTSAQVFPSLEDTLPDGTAFTPSTQSFLRSQHWLEGVQSVQIKVNDALLADLDLDGAPGADTFTLRDLPLDQLVPRLNYGPASPPDSFDAFNLMMAEFSRNGLSMPQGVDGEREARFVTTLDAEAPWTLTGDYQFEPNSRTRPMRFSVINNCLKPGLWELSAEDRAGEVYRAWFDFPHAEYIRFVSKTSGLPVSFVESALRWKTDQVPLKIERLRRVVDKLGVVELRILGSDDDSAGYSTQDSRLKVSKEFARVGKPGNLRGVKTRAELTSGAVYMRDFVPPGKYSLTKDKCFDLRFLSTVLDAEVRVVNPLTGYRFNSESGMRPSTPETYIEIVLHLTGYDIIIGNLPLALLVPNDDFAINGFGVGILGSSAFSERRKLLLDQGPAPSFAYLAVRDGTNWLAVNSHDFGIEQIFVRAHVWDERPWWEITIGSFERIIDIAKYRVEIPDALHSQVRHIADSYIAPLYLTYRDDNLR